MKKKHTIINLGRCYAADDMSVCFTPTIVDRILEAVAIVIGIISFALAYYALYSMPVKTSLLLWLCPLLIPVMTFAFYRLGYASPQKISFPFRITKQNLGMQYLLVVRLSRVLAIFFNLMILCSVLTLLTHHSVLPIIILSLSMLMLVCLVVYFVFAYRYR